jgi:hypothetical protein
MRLEIGKSSIPGGLYTAKYLGSEETTTQLGEALKLKFQIVGGDHDGKEVSRLVNPGATSPKSNVAKFFAALASLSAERGVEIDDADYRGCVYQVLIEEADSGYPRLEKIVKRLDANGKTELESESPF